MSVFYVWIKFYLISIVSLQYILSKDSLLWRFLNLVNLSQSWFWYHNITWQVY